MYKLLFCFALVASLFYPTEQRVLIEHARAYCNENPFELTSISQLEGIAVILSEERSIARNCSDDRRVAISELATIVTEDADNVCTLEKANKVRDYYFKYISTANRDEIKPLADELKEFFLAYGLKLSFECKKHMINSLMVDTENRLEPEDYELVDMVPEEYKFLGDIVNTKDYDDLLFISEVNSLLLDEKESSKSTTSTDDDKVYLETATSDLIKKMKAVCRNRFQPFYRKLIIPILRLSNIGLNYQGEELKIELQEMARNEKVQQWYRIVYRCESLDGVELVEMEDDSVMTENSGEKVIRLFSKEEADKLKAEKGDKVVIGDEDTSVQPLEYNPEFRVQLNDEVYDKSDEHLMGLINNFDTSNSELEHIQKRAYKKITNLVTNLLKGGHIKVLASMFLSRKHGGEMFLGQSANNDLATALNDFVRRKTKSSVQERVVTGLARLFKRRNHNGDVSLEGPIGIALRILRNSKKYNIERTFWRSVSVMLFVSGISMMAISVG